MNYLIFIGEPYALYGLYWFDSNMNICVTLSVITCSHLPCSPCRKFITFFSFSLLILPVLLFSHHFPGPILQFDPWYFWFCILRGNQTNSESDQFRALSHFAPFGGSGIRCGGRAEGRGGGGLFRWEKGDTASASYELNCLDERGAVKKKGWGYTPFGTFCYQIWRTQNTGSAR